MAKYYTSDLHFNHVNILRPDYSNRPWPDIEAMNAGIINNINARIGPEDDLYIIGDFAMGDKDKIPELVRRIMGRKHLVLGNHDYAKPNKIRPQILAADFTSVQETLELEDGCVKLFLAHIPQKDGWNGAHYQLCGHVHNSFTRASWIDDKTEPEQGHFDADPDGKIINVGVDVSDFHPLTFLELIARPHVVGPRHRI